MRTEVTGGGCFEYKVKDNERTAVVLRVIASCRYDGWQVSLFRGDTLVGFRHVPQAWDARFDVMDAVARDWVAEERLPNACLPPV